MKKNGKKNLFVFLCVSPAVILFTIFMIIPTVNVFKMSMYQWGGYSSNKEFVGLANFVSLFQNDSFYRSFQNTVLLIVLVSIVTFSMALIFAGILSREKIVGQNFFRIAFYIPNILSIVVISAIFSAIYDPTNGLLNSVISLFGGEPVLWLGNQQIVIYSIALAMIWQAVGYYMDMEWQLE